MAMSPKLQVRQGQSLVMTPQLQQAIKLLKLSNLELQAFVEEQLEKNPLLERGTGDENRREETVASDIPVETRSEMGLDAPSKAASDSLDAPAHATDADATSSDLAADRAADIGGSVDWSKAGSGGSFNGPTDYDAAANAACEITLSDHLGQQLAMTRMGESDRLVARYLIDLVDEAGYLRADLDELAGRLGVNATRVATVLNILQTFEPTGVFARDLRECLELQLREDGFDDCDAVLLDNLHRLAKHDLSGLMKLCGCTRPELDRRIARLRALAPKPGLAYGSDMAAAVEPDVFVRETAQGGWTVELNTDTLPRVLVNNRYLKEISGLIGESADAGGFITECKENASWLVKSLDQRARTILKVASEIVKQQDAFFAYGVDHMRPMKLRDIADLIEMNESTVSRVTSGKFMATPRGMFELKYFFTTAIASTDGGEGHSAEAVRHKIKILIGEETATTVKSDDKLVALLRAEGIDIARRTVAKYRESLAIPSSVERRRILKHG